jgi:hypothetical protein
MKTGKETVKFWMLYQALTTMTLSLVKKSRKAGGALACRAYGAIVIFGLGELKVCLHLRGDGAKKD